MSESDSEGEFSDELPDPVVSPGAGGEENDVPPVKFDDDEDHGVVDEEDGEEAGGEEADGEETSGVPDEDETAAEPIDPSQGGERRDLAAVAFGGSHGAGGTYGGRLQFGCPECGQLISLDRDDVAATVHCPGCGAEVVAPTARRVVGANEGMRPAVLPSRKPKDGGEMLSVGGLAEDLAEQLERDNPHRLNPDRKPTFQPFDALAARTDEEEAWKRTEAKYAGATPFTRWAIVLLGVALVGVLGYGAVWILGSRKKAAGENTGARELTEEEKLVQRGLEALTAFGDSVDMRSKLSLVRHPELSRPRMEKFYARHGVKASMPIILHGTGKQVTIAGTEFLQFLGEQTSLPVLVFLEIRPDGQLLIDWESMVGYSDENWQMFVLSEPKGSHEFRVVGIPDDYYNHSFSDSKVYRCVRLVDLASRGMAYGYVSRNTATEKELDAIFAGEDAGKGKTVRVKVRFADPGQNRSQVFIESISKGWMEP